jgi:hypothetical protein
MAPAMKIYFLVWVSATVLSAVIVIRYREDEALLSKAYWKFLLEPWKLAAFLAATAMITMAAPYSGDPTWDMPNSVIISTATYILAPWCVAIVYRSFKFKRFTGQTFAALCFFFLPCWIYDIYIYLRDGLYPPTWSSNLVLSGGLTFLAGLFWNLCWHKSQGLTFAFFLETWPPAQRTPFRKVFWWCVMLAIPVMASIGWFVYMYFYED